MMKEELGDVLFQVVFYTQLGSEKNLFSFDDVVHCSLNDNGIWRWFGVQFSVEQN